MPKSQKVEPAVEAIRRSLVTLRRLFQRQELPQLWEAAVGHRSHLDYAEVRLLDAVEVAQQRAGNATVGEVAVQLGVDPSRASRQVTKAITKGLLRRAAAQGDGRQVVLFITARGAAVLTKGHALTRSRIALAVDAWPAAERAKLAALLGRFVERLLPVTSARAGRPGGEPR
jgi:DNA-binding MarR family transcriptional regulator